MRKVKAITKSAMVDMSRFTDKCTLDLSLDDVKAALGTESKKSWTTSEGNENLEALVRQVRAVYGLKDEIKDFGITIYGPTASNADVNVIPRAEAAVLVRIVSVIGSREVFNVDIGAAGKSGSNTFILFPEESIIFKLGTPVASTVSFDNKSVATKPSQAGRRDMKIKKDPSKRYVVVFEGTVDISEAIKSLSK